MKYRYGHKNKVYFLLKNRVGIILSLYPILKSEFRIRSLGHENRRAITSVMIVSRPEAEKAYLPTFLFEI